jgi:hypothetical protein
MTVFDYVSIFLLIAFAIATWIAPYRLGVGGLMLVHVALLVGYFVLAGVAMEIGRYEYDGLLSIIGLALQAFVLNCLLLPIGLVALWRRRKAHNQSLHWTRAARGFPVIPVATERGPGQ